MTAAIDTIAEVGYANASLARIAVRLGISKGVISYHFAGKDDLIAEIVSQVLATGEGVHAASRSKRKQPARRCCARTSSPTSSSSATTPTNSAPSLRSYARRSPAPKSPFTGNRDGAVHILAELLSALPGRRRFPTRLRSQRDGDGDPSGHRRRTKPTHRPKVRHRQIRPRNRHGIPPRNARDRELKARPSVCRCMPVGRSRRPPNGRHHACRRPRLAEAPFRQQRNRRRRQAVRRRDRSARSSASSRKQGVQCRTPPTDPETRKVREQA